MPTGDLAGIVSKEPLRSAPNSRSESLANISADFEEHAALVRAQELTMAYVDLRTAPLQADMALTLDVESCEQALALPYYRMGHRVQMAVVDPAAAATQAYIAEWQKKYTCRLELCSKSGLLHRLDEVRKLHPAGRAVYDNATAEDDVATTEEEAKMLHGLSEDASTLTASELLNRVLVGALRMHASDIHMQCEEDAVDIRFRVDGMLQTIARLPTKYGIALIDQLKYEAKLHLNVRNTPQDGRCSFAAAGRQIDVRISTLPTDRGESVVCRLLDSNRKLQSLKALGFAGNTLEQLENAVTWANGLILITGPTGSGKTTTLYTLLDMLNTADRKIATLEDPVEYRIPRVVQSQIDEEHGMTFSAGLKSLLRQDPDIVLIGEIRDKETAQIAAQAAMTGHLVLSTLHTNSAVETIPRLLNIGLPPYLLASSLRLVVAQRLVRKLHTCAAPRMLTDAEVSTLRGGMQHLKKTTPEVDTLVQAARVNNAPAPVFSAIPMEGAASMVINLQHAPVSGQVPDVSSRPHVSDMAVSPAAAGESSTSATITVETGAVVPAPAAHDLPAVDTASTLQVAASGTTGIPVEILPQMLRDAVGCSACSSIGYSGRSVIAESFVLESGVRDLLLKNATPTELQQYLRDTQHMRTMAEDGIQKVLEGTTTLAEIARTADISEFDTL